MRRRTAASTALLAAGLTTGVLARRRAAARGVDSPAPERTPAPPPPLPGRERTVRTEDGVDLHVEEHGPADAAATLVLAHGYTQASTLWAGQVRDLLAARDDLRVVVYDHRGHGRSGRTSRPAATIEQLGRDLAAVVAAVAPTGPVLLGGHSMGGMALMAFAEQHPGVVADRVVGAAFVGTSAGELAAVTYGLPAPLARLVKRVLPVVNERAVRDAAAGRPRQQVRRLDRALIFGRGADPTDVDAVLQIQADCQAETVAWFLGTFSGHDRAAPLAALAHVPSVVLVGEGDRVCPLQHSRSIAAALPLSELVVYPGPATWCTSSAAPRSAAGWSSWSTGRWPAAPRRSAEPGRPRREGPAAATAPRRAGRPAGTRP